MAERNKHGDENSWPDALRKLLCAVGKLRRWISRAEELADSVEQDLGAWAKAMADGGCPPAAAPAHPAATHRSPSDSTFLLKLAAQSGVQRLEIERHETGEASVRIDGGKAFRLSPTLSALLVVLAQDNATSEGDLVGWKSLAEVSSCLQQHLGRSFTPHAIRQLVSRLRAALAVSGDLNPYFVQTHPKFGLRFALRKAQPGVPL